MQPNKSLVRSLVSDSAIYGIVRYLAVFSALFLTPYYTRTFAQAEYGVLDIFNVWNNMAMLIIPLGLVNTTLRWWVDVKDHPEQRRLVLGTNMTLISIFCLVYLVIMLLVRPLFIQIFIGEGTAIVSRHGEIYYLSIYIVIVSVMVTYFQNIQRSKFQKWSYILVAVLQFFILTIGGFVLVRYFENGVEGFYRAAALAWSAALLAVLYFVRKEIHFVYDNATAKEVIAYGFNFVSVGIMLQATDMMDRYLIRHFYPDLDQNGIYAIGKRIADILLIAVYSFQVAFMPSAMAVKNDPDAGKKYSRVHDFYVMALGWLFLSILIFRSELIQFFAPDYSKAYILIALLGLFNLLNGVGALYTIGLHITKKTRYLSYGVIISVAVHFVASIVLVRFLGINGIAIGTLLGGIVWTILRYYFSNKAYKIHYSFAALTTVILFSVLLFILNPYLDELVSGHLLLALSVKTAIMLAIGLLFVKMFKPGFLIQRIKAG